MEVDGTVGAEPVARPADEIRNCLRRRDPDRVDDHDFVCARLDGRLVHRLEVRQIRARAVDAEERDGDALIDRVRDRVNDALEHRLAVDAERVELEVGDRRLDHARADAELDERLHVRVDGAGEAPDLGPQAGVPDQLDRPPIVRRHAREAGLDPLDAELVETARELELVLWRQDDADRLLAVAERRVVEADTGVECVRLVQVAGPELTHLEEPRRCARVRRATPARRVRRARDRSGVQGGPAATCETHANRALPVTGAAEACR